MDLCGCIGYSSIVEIKHHDKRLIERFIWVSDRLQRVRVHNDEIASQQVADKKLKIHIVNWKHEAKRVHWEGHEAFETSKTTPPNSTPPTPTQWNTSSSKPRPLNIPKHLHQLGTKYSNIRTSRDCSHWHKPCGASHTTEDTVWPELAYLLLGIWGSIDID